MENHRRYVNIAWGIKGIDGSLVSSFFGNAVDGCSYFKDIFHQDKSATIQQILVVTRLFHIFLDQEGNDALMTKVTKK